MKLMIAGMGGLVLLALGAPPEAFGRGFGAGRGGAYAGPRGGAAGGARGGAYVGPRGGSVQAGRAGGVAVGPFGGVHAGGAQGARVTTPGGRSYTTGSAGRVGVGPAGGVRVGGAQGSAYRGPYGGAAAGRTGRVATSPYGGVRVGGAAGVAVGHGTRYVSPTALRTQAGYVRRGYQYRYFTPTWYRGHPGAWVAPRWRVPNYWLAPAWPAVATFCGIAAAPILYDYGSNFVIDNNLVYVNGAQVATAPQYAVQATQFADLGRQSQPAANDEWQSLGVFGLIQGQEQVAQHIFQLAVNKAGVIRGNYYDALSDSNLPVYGSVDPKSQRAAWSIGDKKNVVFETGLNNLTQEQTTVLVHFGQERTQQMMLIRLEQPPDAKQ